MMDLATAAHAVHGRVDGANVRFTRVTTDSRGVEPGDLFVALAGERFDGHDFVAGAIRSPASRSSIFSIRIATSSKSTARRWSIRRHGEARFRASENP